MTVEIGKVMIVKINPNQICKQHTFRVGSQLQEKFQRNAFDRPAKVGVDEQLDELRQRIHPLDLHPHHLVVRQPLQRARAQLDNLIEANIGLANRARHALRVRRVQSIARPIHPVHQPVDCTTLP